MRTIHIMIPKSLPHTTFEELLKKHWRLSKKQIHLLRMNKECKRNHASVLFSDIIYAGDLLTIPVLDEPKYYEPTPIDFEVLFEDEHVLVVNKPKGVKVHPNDIKDTNTMCHGVAYHLKKKNEPIDVRYVHRLDENTTGVLLFAKHGYAHTILDRYLFERKIKRLYGALCQEKFQQQEGTIRAALGKNKSGVRIVTKNGQNAVTHFKVLKQNKEMALVKFELETGRTHQIRIHAAYIGHPILGDRLYGGRTHIFQSQALHAFELSFIHPFLMNKIIVQSKWPYEMDKEIKHL